MLTTVVPNSHSFNDSYGRYRLIRKQSLSYEALFTNFKKGLRNGNWRKLRFIDKVLYRAAMGYAKYGRSIVNGMLVEKHFFQ